MRSVRCDIPLLGPMGVALVLIYPCGKAWKNPPFPLALHRGGSFLAVKGSLRRFAPWTAPGRSEGRPLFTRGKGGGSGRGVRGRVASPLVHDKGHYHSYIAADRRRHDRQVSAARPQRQYVET